MTPEQASEIFAPAAITAVPIDPDDARDEEDFGGAFILAYAVVILTFMAILTYGNWVAQSVAEEKSGRVMELLITAATPRQLLIGKVAGTGAAGLSQYVVIIAAAVIGYLVGGPLSNALGVAGDSPISLPDLNPTMVLTFGAFFVLGFLLYATLYAAAGSMVSRVEDAQQAAGPLIFLAIAGYFIAFTGLNDPDAQWVVVLSVIPFFSPYLMPARMLLTSPSAGEIVLALVLLVLTLALALAIASRIYSAGRAALRAARRPAERLARDARRSMTSLAVTDGRRIELVHGDITTERLDAVANAANEALRGGGGVDGAIHRAAGPGMLEELRARYPDGTPTGSAVATAGHDLPARWVLHAVGPIWQGGDHDEEALLDAAYRSCLRLADELGARSVGFPAISMGIYGYPAADGARVAVQCRRRSSPRRDGDRARAVRPLQRRDVRPLRRCGGGRRRELGHVGRSGSGGSHPGCRGSRPEREPAVRWGKLPRILPDHEGREVLPDRGGVLESVPGATADDPRAVDRGVAVDDEVGVRRQLVLADAALRHRSIGEIREAPSKVVA